MKRPLSKFLFVISTANFFLWGQLGLASPLNSICRTDQETLKSIQNNADQTLWIFMQNTCEGRFDVTESQTQPTPATIEKSVPDVASTQEGQRADDKPETKMGLEVQSVESKATAVIQTISAINEQIGPTMSIDEGPPPAPIKYVPNRFSKYSLITQPPHLASSQAQGLVYKPHVMSVTPHGFYSAFSWHDYQEPGYMQQTGPSIAIGLVDERSVREWDSYPGMGSRFELGYGRVDYEGSGKLSNHSYYALGEVYLPISQGFYLGLGYRRYLDDKVPEDIGSSQVVVSTTGARAYDRLSEYLYMPIGFATKVGGDASFKVQFNALLKGRQTSTLSQTALDFDVTNEQNRGWGIDFAYAPTRNGEVFLRYWNIQDSEKKQSPLTGNVYWEPKNETLEAGVRGWW